TVQDQLSHDAECTKECRFFGRRKTTTGEAWYGLGFGLVLGPKPNPNPTPNPNPFFGLSPLTMPRSLYWAKQTNRQTGQKQYVPHYYSGGHKNCEHIKHLKYQTHTTNRQTGQKQYVPHYYSGGHKNCEHIKHLKYQTHTVID
ncbi:hypothetical protein DPMN_100207, partial [Dreissena polymorpha]